MSESIENQANPETRPTSVLFYSFLLPFFVIVFICLYTLLVHGVKPVSRDQWFMYQAFIEFPGWLEAAFMPFSNHLTIIPNLFFYADFKLFNASNTLLQITSLWCLLAIPFIYSLTLDSPELSKPARIISLAWFIACLFFLNDFAMIGWPFIGTQHYLMFLFFLLAALLYLRFELHSPQTRLAATFPVILLLVFATFCFGGFLAFPAMIAAHIFYRGKLSILAAFSISLLLCLAFYFYMTDEHALNPNQVFSFKYAINFYFSLIGSPIFYLLKPFSFIDQNLLKYISFGLGILFSGIAYFLSLKMFYEKKELETYTFISFLFLLIGLGAPLVILLFRNPMFWDPFVDRYQIWATCFYMGIPFLFKNSITKKPAIYSSLLLVLFILMLPSQVQHSQRVIDYRQNVERGLIDYENGFLDDDAQRELLHFGWESKTETFLFTQRYLKQLPGNFFIDYQPKKQPSLGELEQCGDKLFVRIKDSLPVTVAVSPESLGKTAARYFLELEEDWQYVYLLDQNFAVLGKGKKMQNSFLPRNLVNWQFHKPNGYASTLDKSRVDKIVFTDRSGKGVCFSGQTR